MIHLRPPIEDLGCWWCDHGHARICFENPNTNPLHHEGMDLIKCSVPDSVYESERYDEQG